MAEKKPSEVLGGWNQQVAEQLGQIADNTGGEGTAQAGSEKRPSDVLGGWYKEVSDLLDDIATNTEGGGGGDYELPTMSPTTKGGATVGAGLTMDGTALSVDFTEVASVDALEDATALSPTGGIVSTQDGLAVSPEQSSTGAIDGALLELTAKSKPATQQTTTGKNLLPNTATSQTINGVTFTVNADGSVTCNGTASSNTDISIASQINFDENTYTLSTGTTSPSGVVLAVNTTLGIKTTRSSLTFSGGINGSVWVNIVSGTTVSNLTLYPQIELGSTATPYEPYTGGAPSPSPDYPQPIVTVKGRNLIDESRSSLNSLVLSTNGNEMAYPSIAHTEYIKVEADTDYYVTNGVGLGSQHSGAIYDANKQYLRALIIPGAGVQSKVINTGTNAAYVIINYFMSVSPMLTLGSTPQPYVPYGYVGLERRDSQGTLLDTTPIPLPSRGWVAGLSDGTADELSVDGAGKVVWTEQTNETTTAATDGITGTVGVDVMSTTGQIADGATVLYKLATPVTETCGYIDLPDMQDCVLSIPELDALGVRYTIGDGAEIARQWYQRAMSELDDTQDAIVDLAADVTALDGRVTVTERRLDVRGTVYGFHVDSGESDSTACVTYLADALGMTPAHMDYANQRFDYGSWENAFFMPRPCMLKYDGTVDYYLDPNDYAKKLDGTASDVADPTYAGNAMMEWGRDGKIIWYKVVPDADPTSYSVYIADNQVDDAYVCYPFVNGDGDIVKHFYTPCYFGSIVNDGTKDVLRSLSGQLGSTRCKNKNATVERTMAKANNPEGIDIWDTEVYADVILVNFLLTLISKSLDSQTAFGQGLHTSGTDAINDGFTSGVHDAKGLFCGTNSGAAGTYTNAVKVFGMENWWGFMWRRFAGLVAVNGTEKYKLTRGTQDGSTANDYVVSTTGSAYDGYLTGGTLPSASGSYISKQELRPDGSYTPTVVGGSASTYYRDGLWTNIKAVTYAFRGGSSYNGARVGAWSLNLGDAASGTAWNLGAAPSCKPQSPEAAMASRIKKLEQTVAQLVAGA